MRSRDRKWLVDAKPEADRVALRRGDRRDARGRGELRHTASYTCAVAALAALRGEDVAWLPDAVAERLAGGRLPVSEHQRFVITGAGRDWPTAQEAALKLREGVHVAAEAHLLEEPCTDTSPRSTRASAAVLEGRAGRPPAPPRPPPRSSCSAATSLSCRPGHPALDIAPPSSYARSIVAEASRRRPRPEEQRRTALEGRLAPPTP